MSAAAPAWPIAAYAGSLVGVCGWTLGLLGLCLAHARFDLVWSLGVPALCVSLALGILLLLAHRLAVCACAASREVPHLVLIGGAHVLVATLLLLAGEWVMPALLADPGLRATLDGLGAAQTVPIAVPILALVGVVLLGVAATRVRHSERAPA